MSDKIQWLGMCLFTGAGVSFLAAIVGHPRQTWRFLKGLWDDTGRR